MHIENLQRAIRLLETAQLEVARDISISEGLVIQTITNLVRIRHEISMLQDEIWKQKKAYETVTTGKRK